MEIFLICPVRKAGDAVNERIAAYVAELESGGDHVHWPKRDVTPEQVSAMAAAIRKILVSSQ